MTLTLMFALVSQTYNLPPHLLESICYVESNHNPRAIVINDGGSNSIGVCQVKLATARFLGFKGHPSALHGVNLNAQIAARYLRFQLTRYHGNVYKAISAYNSGTYRVGSYGIAKNCNYVNKVLIKWSTWEAHVQN